VRQGGLSSYEVSCSCGLGSLPRREGTFSRRRRTLPSQEGRLFFRLGSGLAFAGKSTLGRRLVERTEAALLSLDDINAERGLHGGTGIPAEEWMKTHREALARLAALLELGLSVVVDDTNCFRWLRDDYRTVADRWSVPVTVVYLDVPLDLALQRARENDVSRHRPVVTEEILRELARTFEAPGPDEQVVVFRSPEPVEAWIERWF
jgi:predicted kinase